MRFSTVKYLLLTILVGTSTTGCYDNVQSSIPDLPVSLQLNLTTTYPTFKNSSNQYLLFEKRYLETDRIGYGGILVCTGVALDDYGNSTYFAFDMACPYEADKDVKVYPDENSLGKVVCEKCGSVFDVGYGFGNPLSGPAKETLKKYRTTISGDYLIVSIQ